MSVMMVMRNADGHICMWQVTTINNSPILYIYLLCSCASAVIYEYVHYCAKSIGPIIIINGGIGRTTIWNLLFPPYLNNCNNQRIIYIESKTKFRCNNEYFVFRTTNNIICRRRLLLHGKKFQSLDSVIFDSESEGFNTVLLKNLDNLNRLCFERLDEIKFRKKIIMNVGMYCNWTCF